MDERVDSVEARSIIHKKSFMDFKMFMYAEEQPQLMQNDYAL